MSNRAERRRAAKHPAPRTAAPSAPVPAPAGAAGEPEALVVTHYLEAADLASASSIHLTGTRTDGPGSFSRDDHVSPIPSDGGRVAVTSWVYGVDRGTWAVSAAVKGHRLDRAGWSWRRWTVSPEQAKPVATRSALLAPLAVLPGVIPGIWGLLGVLALVLAVVAQALMLPHEGVEVPLSVSLVALAAGLAGAKVWYAMLHPGPWRTALLGGWAVDGFLVVAPLVAVIALLALRLPIAAFLDAITPGLFLAVAVGRIGCFLAGCCAGRVTDSRFAVWASDRKVMARRIPTQFLESAAGLAIASLAALVILGHVSRPDGAVFLGSLGLYLLVRHGLLRLRAERREFLWQRAA